MLERLMNSNVYERDASTNLFNGRYVTQLVRNYRSHEAILHVSNELFYDNVLQTNALKGITTVDAVNSGSDGSNFSLSPSFQPTPTGSWTRVF